MKQHSYVSRIGCTCAGLTMLLFLAEPGLALQAAPAQRGQALFAGNMRFHNGGPPCASCHNAAGLPFPGGGSLGPDLSRASAKLGTAGMDAALQTLFFPTMMPLFDTRPLTADEQQALKAFLDRSTSLPAPKPVIPVLSSASGAAFLCLLALTWIALRHRVRHVRATMVRVARSRGGLNR